MTTAHSTGSTRTGMQPRNMHTDAEPPQVQPLNMHTDIVVTSADPGPAADPAVVVVVGDAGEHGRVGVALPAAVAARLKAKATPVHVVARRSIGAPTAAPSTIYTLGDRARVSGDLAGGLVVSGTAEVDGVEVRIRLDIAGAALAALRRQRDAL